MTLRGIFSSPSQRRSFLLTSLLSILVLCLTLVLIYSISPDASAWNLVLAILAALVSSSLFAVVSGLYVTCFFEDPYEVAAATKLLPKDIGPALIQMAEGAQEYKLMVRTGRHFRAEVLPVIINSAKLQRRRVTIQAILLDFRNAEICEKYASYRRSSSFDRHNWSEGYVQKEIVATALRLLHATVEHPEVVRVNLYLSTRLSTFRIDGTHDEVIVTREDPKDTASRYGRSDDGFSGYLNEFDWARDGASEVKSWEGAATAAGALEQVFEDYGPIVELGKEAQSLIDRPSPYGH